MPTQTFKGNKNRIVRVFDDTVYNALIAIAETQNVPLQTVFDALMERVSISDLEKLGNIKLGKRVK